MQLEKIIQQIKDDGYAVINDLLSAQECDIYKKHLNDD